MPFRSNPILTCSLIALTALLAGCGRSASPVASAAGDSVLTVLQPGAATDAQLEAQYQGQLVTRTPGFAVLTVSGDHARLAPLGTNVRVEKNRKVYRVSRGSGQNSSAVDGSASINWYGSASINWYGSASINWYGSASINWYGSGQYGLIPENTTTWQQVLLDDVQTSNRAGGQGVTVAIIDTGVDVNHPALSGRLSAPSTWHDFVGNDDLPQDEGELGSGLTGHGTEIAGIVAQVAPFARLMPLRVLDTDGTGDTASVVAAIVWATDHGANVINLSLGANVQVMAVSQAIAYANSHNVAVAAAAGNAGTEGLDYPAAEFANQPLNVSVGSVNSSDAKSSFSQYGAALKLLAPGEGVYGPAPQERLGSWSGTSASTPIVAGGLALGMGLGVTAAQAASALTGTADSVNTLSANSPYAGKLGSGRVNLSAAVSSLGH